MRPANKLFSTLARPILFAGLLLMVAGMAYFYLTPKTYLSVARLKVEKGGFAEHPGTKTPREVELDDPELARDEAQQIRSDAILDQVIKNLHLVDAWGRSENAAAPPSLKIIREKLRSLIGVQASADSGIIEIAVSSPDMNEPALIANELARVYQADRQKQRQITIDDKFAAIQKQWDDQNGKVQAAKNRLYFARQAALKNQPANDKLYYDSERYFALKTRQEKYGKTFSIKEKELIELRKLNPAELRLALAKTEDDNNSIFSLTYGKLRAAQNELTRIRIAQGENSPAFKKAQLEAATLDSELKQITDGILLLKASDLKGIQTGLDEINAELKTAVTNDLRDGLENQDPVYRAALAELKSATAERDALQAEMNDKATLAAAMPVAIKVQIIEPAEMPRKPNQPSLKVFASILGGSCLLLMAGFMLLLVARRNQNLSAPP